jgi:hypothetical protein
VDAATKNRDGPYDPSMFLKDPSIDSWIRQPKVIDAFTWILLEAYSDSAFEFASYPLLKQRRDETIADTDEGGMWDLFDVTGNPADTITFTEFKTKLKGAHIRPPSIRKTATILQDHLQSQLRVAALRFDVLQRPGERGKQVYTLYGIKAKADYL